ncbi:hypothetical protein KUTeg_019141 [Tegillarca granosa]|uniref:MHC class II antigen beta chain n=1 Tax=Tegillarca granosa TaxID=220873 RepID=A0ABQ9EH38_TEGGR|nr:hypothetical protein KUTeg_019141 [Tegillarca granosa]
MNYVSKLEVKYSLVNRPDMYVIQQENCSFKETEFYFHKDHVTSFTDINREIAKFFGRKDERCYRDLSK